MRDNMAQFGADTIIGPQVKVLACDCFDTLVEMGPDGYVKRQGVAKFLNHYGTYRSLPLIVVSDADPQLLEQVLTDTGLRGWFKQLYHRENAIITDDQQRLIKDFGPACSDFSVHPGQIGFVGDSKIDALSAERAGVYFVRVPGSADRDFSFERLIGGASQYNSGEYVDRMLDDLAG